MTLRKVDADNLAPVQETSYIGYNGIFDFSNKEGNAAKKNFGYFTTTDTNIDSDCIMTYSPSFKIFFSTKLLNACTVRNPNVPNRNDRPSISTGFVQPI